MLVARIIVVWSSSLVLLGACDRHIEPSGATMQDIGDANSSGAGGQAGPQAGSQAGSAGQAPVDVPEEGGTDVPAVQDAAPDDPEPDDDAGVSSPRDAAVSLDPSLCPDGFARGIASEVTRQIVALDPSPVQAPHGACSLSPHATSLRLPAPSATI